VTVPQRKSVEEMAADWLREASVLIAVFALLDKVARDTLTIPWLLGAMMIAAVFFTLGAALERYRRS
jgi:hypothetical protein